MNLLLAEEHNWGFRMRDDWDQTNYKLSDSGELNIAMFYPLDPVIERKVMISNTDFSSIVELIGSLTDDQINRRVEACDGTAWHIAAYDAAGSEKFERNLGYIYGIEPFEQIVKILMSYEPSGPRIRTISIDDYLELSSEEQAKKVLEYMEMKKKYQIFP